MATNTFCNCDEDVVQGLDIDKLLSSLPNLLSKMGHDDGDPVPSIYRQKDKTTMSISVDTTVYINEIKCYSDSKQYKSVGTTPLESRNATNPYSRIYYPMDRLGDAFIISNKTFLIHRERRGTEIDAKGMEELLTNLGFNVTVYHNLAADEMNHYLSQAADKDYSSKSALVIVILTHGGKQGALLGSDDACIYVNDIEDMFSKCTTLKNKPKVFIVQACRGGEQGTNKGSDDAWISPDNMLKQSQHISPEDKADFLFAYSTLPGYVSWRNTECGSWFISTLITVFKSNAHRDHIVDLLIKTNQELSSKYNQKQICHFECTLTCKLYFKIALQQCMITE